MKSPVRRAGETQALRQIMRNRVLYGGMKGTHTAYPTKAEDATVGEHRSRRAARPGLEDRQKDHQKNKFENRVTREAAKGGILAECLLPGTDTPLPPWSVESLG